MLYLDTSAFLKLLVSEEHSVELRVALAAKDLWASVLLDVEAHRAARRLGVPPDVVGMHLEAVTLVSLADGTVHTARSVGTDTLRTLDALHLATASELADDLDGLVTYDRRLAAAANDLSIKAVSPGLPDGWWVDPPG